MGAAVSVLPRRSRENDENQNASRVDQYVFHQTAENGIFDKDYIMGGQKFETTEPQKYLFGSITDLNYLGPYGPSGSSDSNLPKIHNRGQNVHPGYVRPINILINIRKHSIRLVRAPSLEETKEDCEKFKWFHVEFTVDCSVPCYAKISYMVKETPKGQLIAVSECSTKTDQLEFATGMDQQFCMLNHRICPSKILKNPEKEKENDDCWSWEEIQVVIQLRTKNAKTEQIFYTYCSFEKNSQDTWVLKPLKQRVRVGKFAFSLQEVYGIEKKAKGEELESECAICWDEPRDTLILPCRHLAVCAECAEKIRYQQSACPICRKPFKALLKLHIPNMTKPLSEALNSLPDGAGKYTPQSSPNSDKENNLSNDTPESPTEEPTEDPSPNPDPEPESENTPAELDGVDDVVDKYLDVIEDHPDITVVKQEDVTNSNDTQAKISQDSGISSLSRRDSELSITDEATVLKTSKASDDSGGSADSTKFLLHDSAVHV